MRAVDFFFFDSTNWVEATVTNSSSLWQSLAQGKLIIIFNFTAAEFYKREIVGWWNNGHPVDALITLSCFEIQEKNKKRKCLLVISLLLC
jgi:hypothetical protein